MLCKTRSSCLRKEPQSFHSDPRRVGCPLFTRTGEAQRPSDPRRFPFFSLAVVVNSQWCPGNTGHAAAECPRSGRACNCIRLADLATSSVMVMLSLGLLSIPIACPGTSGCASTLKPVRSGACEIRDSPPSQAKPSPDVGTAFRRVEYGVKV